MIKATIKRLAASLGYEIRAVSSEPYGDVKTLAKASVQIERFREVVSDPLNLLIARVPEAGYVDRDGCVILHNGTRVPATGAGAYYGNFSDLLIINRGVHEPLEEFCFQEVLRRLDDEAPTMIELGAYWAHYSMWLQKARPGTACYLVEPDPRNLECGRRNLALNGCRGEFIQQAVSSTGFRLDAFVTARALTRIDVLHADIQGYEVEMLDGGRQFLSAHGADYVFVSTHSQKLHSQVVGRLSDYAYRIEVSSDFETHTTSCDGFVLATSPRVRPVFNGLTPLGRVDIARSSPAQLVDSILAIRP